jgi:hypothetical protein
MAASLSTEIKASLAWLLQDAQELTTVADASRLDYALTLDDGATADHANGLWHDLRTVAAAANHDLVLSGLAQTLFGSAITVGFTAIKGLLIVNTAAVAGEDLIVGAAASHPWGAPFGATTHQVRVPAGACLLLVNSKPGWTVTSGSADVLRVANAGTGSIAYKIALVGVRA